VTDLAAQTGSKAYSAPVDPTQRISMRTLLLLAVTAALTACGVETATTAATAASLKKQELEQGKKTMDQTQQKIGGAMEQMQQRADNADK
jgi:ABC-type glycerol-3-phosphate transport system substrate-binding protein